MADTKDGVLIVEEENLPDYEVECKNGIYKIPNISYTDKTYPSGRWLPAFPETSLEKQEEYVVKMIERDKK